MSYGLRIWDGSGGMRLDITDRTARLYGVYTIPSIAANGSYTLTIPSFSLGAWFFDANLPRDIYVVPSAGKITFYHTNLVTRAAISFTVVIFQV